MGLDHKSKDVLQTELKEAGTRVKIGQKYAHYKNPNNTYTVINIAITEADDELCVVYQADYAKELVFVRPLRNWLEVVDRKGTKVDRFKLIR